LALCLLAVVAMGYGTRLPAEAQDHTVTNTLGMTFVLIPAGRFMMGSLEVEANRDPSETQHQVTISQPFYLQTTEVTVDQWRAVMGRRFFARKRGAGNMPVVKVSWHDCQKFIHKLNRMTGKRYTLPTEAQWEFAARAGSTTAFFWGNQIDCRRAMYANNPMKYDECVSVNRNRGIEPGNRAPVKQYPPNAWGLYDMHGNVWEWCEDFFDHYPSESQIDPCQTDSGQYRVRRGGSWFGPGNACRSANRAYGHTMSRMQNTGFRLVMIPPVQTDPPE
jgi:formylglycine-generating enzyme required for sulfatase activity